MADQNEAPEAPKPSKMDALLEGLIKQVRELSAMSLDLALPNDPAGDPIAQTAGRTQALSKVVHRLGTVVESLVNVFGAAVGGMGAVLGGLNEKIDAIRNEVDGLKAPVAEAQEAQETIEVDNTGAQGQPTAPLAVVPSQAAPPARPPNGRRAQPRPAAPAPAQPSAPAGMPPEVAQIQGAPSAAIASVTVKP